MGHLVSNWGDKELADAGDVASALIFSSDTATKALLVPAFNAVAIGCNTCEDAGTFHRLASCRRYEVACIDFSLGEHAADAVVALRSSASNRTAIVIAVTVNSEQSNRAFACGVHFVIQQPISPSSVEGIIRAAYGLIIRERRRYYRCPLTVNIVAHRRSEAAWIGRAENVSEGGMCMMAAVRLHPGDLVAVEFRLPCSSAEISAEAEVQWRDVSGRVGLHFLAMRRDCKSDLQHWLTNQLDKRLKPALARLELQAAARETFLSRLY